MCVSCNKSTIKKGSISEYKLQLLTQDHETSHAYKGALAFAQKLEELSGGTMTVEFNNIESISHLSELIDPVRKGEFDIVITGYGYLSYAVPELELIAQAYVVTDYENYIKTLDSDYGRKITKEINKIGLVPSEIWYMGTAQITSNTPLNSLADFKGLRLRVPPADANIAFAEAIGTIALPTSLSGVYNALNSKFINAQSNPISTIEIYKLYELQKYIAMTSHFVRASSLFINKKMYDSFSAEQEAWYNEAVEYGRQVCYDIVTEEEAYLLDKYQNEYGMIVTYPNIDELREAMHPIYDKIRSQIRQRLGL